MYIVGPLRTEVTQENLLDFFALREKTFVQSMGWSIPTLDGFEMDQYDFPFAYFVLAYSCDDRCIGGGRLLQTHRRYEAGGGREVTYMLRDFASGEISSPLNFSHMKEQMPQSPHIWELTRFVSNNRETAKALLYCVDDFLVQMGAKEVLTLSRPSFSRLLSGLGFETRQISETVRFSDDSNAYAALSTKVGRRLENSGRVNTGAAERCS